MSRILLIEPVLMHKELFVKLLEGTRFHVEKWVTNGEEAVAFCKETHPDLVVLSLAAPGYKDNPSEGGIKIIPKLLQADPNIRIIVSFTVDTQYLIMAAMRAGAVEKIKIPLRKESVLEALAKAESLKSSQGTAIIRSELRIKKPLPIKYKKSSDGFFKPMRSTITEDISTSGLMMHVTEKIPEKTILKLKISIPGINKVIKANGQVVRSKSAVGNLYEVGISFTEIAPKDVEILKSFILSSVSKSK